MKIIRRGAKRPRPPKPTSAWKLVRGALSDLRRGWKRYIFILAIVAVPLDLALLIKSLAADASFQAFGQFAAITMNVALVWALVQKSRTGHIPRPAAAYYDGSASLVRYVIVTFFLVLMLIPAAIAATLFIVGIVAVETAGTVAELVSIGFICLLISTVSIWLLVRFGLAPIITVATDLRPIAALRYSRRLTMGRFWRVFARYAALVLFIIIIAIPIAGLTAGLSYLKLGAISTLVFQLVTTFTALPLLNSYLLRLYRDLESRPEPAAAEITID